MTKLEMALCAFSVIETIISAVLWKRTVKSKWAYEKLYAEYQDAAERIGIPRNAR